MKHERDTMVTETQRKRRGHAFLPPKVILKRIPRIYATENTRTENKMVWIHYFSAAGDWYVTEYDPNTGEAFGYARLGAEWGYIDLNELEQVNAFHGLVIVERDMFWTPKQFKEIGK
jgi:hypothetical protein